MKKISVKTDIPLDKSIGLNYNYTKYFVMQSIILMLRYTMQVDADLRKLVRRTYLSFFQDGLWDIFLGLFIVGWGVGMLTDMAYLVGSLFVCFYFIIWGLKRWLTYPRIGYVKLGDKEKKIRLGISIVLGIMVLIGLVFAFAFITDERPQWLMDYFPLIFSGMLAVVVSGISISLGVYRFLVYAMIIFIAGSIHQWSDIKWAYTYTGAGSLIGLIGIIVLVRFIRHYPKQTEEAVDIVR